MFMFISALGATAIVFLLSRMAGDPTLVFLESSGYGVSEEQVQNLRKKLGVDKPLVVQYGMWLSQLARGDMGRTLIGEKKVATVIREKFGATLQLAIAGWLFATVVGVPLGVLSAVKRGSIWDYLARGVALFGQATPAFWIAIIGVLIFAVTLGWLPSGLKGEGFSPKHFVLPAITVGWGAAAGYLRLTRSAMLEVLDSEYIRFARAKGVNMRVVIWKHAFRNALLQPLTASILLFAGLLNGQIVAESIFAWPGIGRVALLQGVWDNDFPLLTGAVLVFIMIYLFMALLADILYGVIDPRIRYD
jgi:ABC-type dipeptide/oligopeptide/nickel transport system permease component